MAIASAQQGEIHVPEPQLFHIDAFTTTRFRGNPAGVVLYADALSEVQMQDIARELKHSETAFVLKPTGNDHDIHIRYFTPTTEVPICGHATIAAHYALAKWIGYTEPITHIRQKTGAGVQAISIRNTGTDYRVTMCQGPISFGEPVSNEIRNRIAKALGLNSGDFVDSLPVQIVSTGHSKVIIPLRNGVNLDALCPSNELLSEISVLIGCNGYFPFLIREMVLQQRMAACLLQQLASLKILLQETQMGLSAHIS